MVQSGRVCAGSEGKLALSFVRVIASEQKYLNLLPADFDFIKFKSQFGNKKKIKPKKTNLSSLENFNEYALTKINLSSLGYSNE